MLFVRLISIIVNVIVSFKCVQSSFYQVFKNNSAHYAFTTVTISLKYAHWWHLLTVMSTEIFNLITCGKFHRLCILSHDFIKYLKIINQLIKKYLCTNVFYLIIWNVINETNHSVPAEMGITIKNACQLICLVG